MNDDKKLDKYYTKKEVAKECYATLKQKLGDHIENYTFLEPSAGDGSFSDLLSNYEAYDLKPGKKEIIEANFLNVKLEKKNYITIGNPPFGKKCQLAISFFNRCSECSDVIAFILPVSFLKWNVQKQLSSNFKLIYTEYLKQDSFTFQGKNYSLRSCFQIWVKNGSCFDKFKDLRMKKSPPTEHEDLVLWQHNATEQSRKYVDEDWEVCLWRQGHKDYSEIFTKKEDYEKIKDLVYNTNLQFFFIKFLNQKAREIFYKMDLNSLAERNMITPGFGKADFVSYYIEIKEREINENF